LLSVPAFRDFALLIAATVYLTGCDRVQTGADATPPASPISKTVAAEPVRTEKRVVYTVPADLPPGEERSVFTAIELIRIALKENGESDACLRYRPTETDGIVVTVELREVHDSVCGGDPEVDHLRDIYKVDTLAGRVSFFNPFKEAFLELAIQDNKWFEIEKAPIRCTVSEGPGEYIKLLREKDINYNASDQSEKGQVVTTEIKQYNTAPARKFYRGLVRCADMALFQAFGQAQEQRKYR
jgi:hypothetical protein